MYANRPAMSCGLRFLQKYERMSPAQIITQLKTTHMMATYVIVQHRPKARSKKLTPTDKLLNYIKNNKLGEIIQSPEVFTPPGITPKQWSQSYLWRVDFNVLNKFNAQ